MSENKDPLFRYLALLQLIPRWPGRIATPVLLERLRDKGFEIDKRSLQRDLRDKLAGSFPILCDDSQRPYRWSLDRDAAHGLPALDTASALALHRIRSAAALEAPAREHEGFDIDRYSEGGAFAWRQSPDEVELIADVSPQTAWLLDEPPLSREQRLEQLPGSDWQCLHASVPLDQDQETLWWIFGLNDQIRVHAPQVWVEKFGRKVVRLREMYM